MQSVAKSFSSLRAHRRAQVFNPIGKTYTSSIVPHGRATDRKKGYGVETHGTLLLPLLRYLLLNKGGKPTFS